LEKKVFRFILLLGLVSLFADITYEGGRSIIGPYLALLGATAFIVGLASGLGEFLGYGFRIVSGYFADKTGKYWFITFLGYFLTFVAIPLLALAYSWEWAFILILLERIGRGIRIPARDTLLSTVKVGKGYAFGLHEAIDQIGASIGPILVASILYFKESYSLSFALLSLPAILSITFLFSAMKFYQRSPTIVEEKEEIKEIPKNFWFYILFVVLTLLGFTHFQLISYHFKVTHLFLDEHIPLLFALAMGVDALIGISVGRIYDKVGFSSLIIVPLLSLPIAPFAFSFNYPLMILSMVLWGGVMGAQETIMRAAIADIIPLKRRGIAYGIFNTLYGLAWFLGNLIMGILYELNMLYLIYFSLIFEFIAFFYIIKIKNLLKMKKFVEKG